MKDGGNGLMKEKSGSFTMMTSHPPDSQEHKKQTPSRMKGSPTDLSHSIQGSSAVQSEK